MDDFLWVEKYRPKDIQSCILQKALQTTLTEFISNGDIPNCILSGGPGVGKTTAAKAMLDELGLTYMFINGSMQIIKDYKVLGIVGHSELLLT